MPVVPYCGLPPVPGLLLQRWNGDLVLIAALVAVAIVHLRVASSRARSRAALGWAVAAFALLSPLCALSVSLFAARIGQHMILVLAAAPLIGSALPRGSWRSSPWWSALIFSSALWVWHMPVPYDATFLSSATYWAMHMTLFGSAIWLWRDLINHRRDETVQALAAGTFASMAMALLGAVITLSGHPIFLWHLATTEAWGFTPLADQQLGGVLMWVPGCVLFIAVALRSTLLLWQNLEAAPQQ